MLGVQMHAIHSCKTPCYSCLVNSHALFHCCCLYVHLPGDYSADLVSSALIFSGICAFLHVLGFKFGNTGYQWGTGETFKLAAGAGRCRPPCMFTAAQGRLSLHTKPKIQACETSAPAAHCARAAVSAHAVPHLVPCRYHLCDWHLLHLHQCDHPIYVQHDGEPGSQDQRSQGLPVFQVVCTQPAVSSRRT